MMKHLIIICFDYVWMQEEAQSWGKEDLQSLNTNHGRAESTLKICFLRSMGKREEER